MIGVSSLAAAHHDEPLCTPSTFGPTGSASPDEWIESVPSDTDSVHADGHADAFASPDQAAERLRALHRLHSKQLLGYLVKLTLGDFRIAEDIAQETFVRAWRHLVREPDTDLEEFRPWLYTVARRLVVDMVRARRSRPVEVIVEDLARLSTTGDSSSGVVMADQVRAALMRLEPAQRKLLIDLYFHGRSPREVAKDLNIPVGTVKSRAYYAKRALRTYLTE